jgi:hypothetical protein
MRQPTATLTIATEPTSPTGPPIGMTPTRGGGGIAARRFAVKATDSAAHGQRGRRSGRSSARKTIAP